MRIIIKGREDAGTVDIDVTVDVREEGLTFTVDGEDVSDLRKALEGYRDRVSDLEYDVEDLEDEVDRLEGRIIELEAEVQRLERDNECLEENR